MAPARLLSEKRRDMELPKDIERPKERSRKPHKHTTKPSSVVSSTTTKSRYKTISPTATSNHYKTTPLSAREEPTRTHRRKRTSTPQSSSSESSPDDSDGGDGAENAWAVNDATTRAFPSPPTSASPTGESSSNTKAVSARSSRDADAPQPNDEDEAPILSPAVPDPPNVFAFLEHDSEDEHDHEPDLHHEVAHLRGAKTDIPWVPGTIFDCPPLPGQMSPGAASMSPSSSSGAGSFHSDVSMALPRETADEHGNKTDRSTSPEPGRMDTTERKSEDKLEKEVEDNVDRNEADGLAETDTSVPTGEAATKLASQMLAAQHRQTLSSSFGSPQAARRTLQSRTHSHRRRHTSSHAPSPPPQAEPIHAEHHYPSYHYPELAYAQQQIVASPPLPLPVMHMHQQPLQSIAHPIAQQTFPPYSPMMHHHQQQQPVTPHSQHAPHAHHHQPTGYSALSLKISSRPFPSESNETIRPLYRRFEHLNHRVLLHMQDELSELEAQLQALDDADCARRAYGPLSGGLSGSGPSGSGPSREGATGRPESRRQTATFAARGDELSWRREELLRVVVWKVQVYNKALRELDKLVKELPPADDSDVDAYREFLKEGNHVVEQETRFLDEVGDLVVVGGTARGGEQRGGKGRTALGGAGERHVHFASEDQDLSQRMRSRDGRVGPPPPPSPYVLAFAPAAATLLPIMVFPFITSFAGRVIVAGLLGGAVAVIACLCVGLESLPAPHRDSGTANMALVCAGVWGVMMFVLCGWL